ncbi:toxin co-regulated pilus biosynthesis Q family protein (plasmid) [Polaromonas sp. P1-6]|nr:toxin co-regulated pilus biosynthesis Q family protein [Polaromonas sp. P1-6]
MAPGKLGDQVAASAVYQASPVLQAGFEVTPADQNLRRTLVRWSKMVGWAFDAEHWTMGSDIPVAGSASLGNDFKAAVRTLLASSEMTDLPAQPCFYSNNVLRVIPLNELCSRQQAPKAQ